MTPQNRVHRTIGSGAKAAWAGWNQYFFGEAPLQPLAVYRMLFCGIVCAEALYWFPYSEELFSTEGFHIPYSFFAALMSPFEAKVFCGLLILSSLFACIGYFTRLNLCITLLCYAMLHSVDSINEKAVETIVMVILVVLIFSPCGSVLSLDVAAGRVVRRERGCIFSQRLLQWEFAQIYFFCGVTKLMVPEWPNGKVFLDSLTGRWASDFGVWVSSWLPEWATRLGGFGTVIFELQIGPLLLARGSRWLAVPLALIFHMGIEATLAIGSLGMQFMAADIILFFNPERSAKVILTIQGYILSAWAKIRALIPLPMLRPTAANDAEVFN